MLKRDSDTGFFLWILRTFYEHLCLQNISGGCFCISVFWEPRPVHCVKSVQIRSFSWFVFSRIRTEYGLEETPYLDTFHTVVAWSLIPFFFIFDMFTNSLALTKPCIGMFNNVGGYWKIYSSVFYRHSLQNINPYLM